MARQRFNFLNNALSKCDYLLAFWYIITFQSGRIKKKSKYQLAQIAGVSPEQIFFFGAGRMSIYSLLKALSFSEKDEVIVAGYTCVVLTNSVKFAGCQVRYVDIDPLTLNMNEEILIKSVNDKTKMIIIPHNFGLAFNGIRKIKELYPEVILVEDAAHCFGSRDQDGEFCGTISDAGFFSLEFSKPLTTGLGGAMIINNPLLLERFNRYYSELPPMSIMNNFRIIVTLGAHRFFYWKKSMFFYSNIFRLLRVFKLLYVTSNKEISGELPEDYPTVMRDSLTCFLWQQLKKIEEINSVKKAIAERYDEVFSEFRDFHRLDTEDSILVRYPLVFKDNIELTTIVKIRQEAIEQGLNLGSWFNDVVHPIGSYRYCYDIGMCPVGESVALRIINLPVNVNYSDLEIELKDLIALLRKHNIN